MWHTVNADTLDHFCSVESISYAINALIRFYKLNNLFVSVARVTYYKCARNDFLSEMSENDGGHLYDTGCVRPVFNGRINILKQQDFKLNPRVTPIFDTGATI